MRVMRCDLSISRQDHRSHLLLWSPPLITLYPRLPLQLLCSILVPLKLLPPCTPHPRSLGLPCRT